MGLGVEAAERDAQSIAESSNLTAGKGARVGVNKISPATRATRQHHAPKMSIDFPKEEERILKRWEEIDAFLTQVELVSNPKHQKCASLGANQRK